MILLHLLGCIDERVMKRPSDFLGMLEETVEGFSNNKGNPEYSLMS